MNRKSIWAKNEIVLPKFFSCEFQVHICLCNNMELWQCKKGIPTYLESATKKIMLATSYLLGLINNHLRLLQNQRKKLTKILHYGNKYNKTIDTILTDTTW